MTRLERSKRVAAKVKQFNMYKNSYLGEADFGDMQ